MINVIDKFIERKEKEFSDYKNTCQQLENALNHEGITFAESYNIMISEEYKDIVSQDLWRYVFKKYDLPLARFSNGYAGLDYDHGNFTVVVPLLKREGDRISVSFSFWRATGLASDISLNSYKRNIDLFSGIITRLERCCLNERFSIIDVLFPTAKGRAFVAAVVYAKQYCHGSFPAPKKKSDMLFKKTRDAFVLSIIDCAKKDIEYYEEQIESKSKEIAEAKKEYNEIKDDVEKAIAVFKGCYYENNILIHKP